jgi:hypothetical protein
MMRCFLLLCLQSVYNQRDSSLVQERGLNDDAGDTVRIFENRTGKKHEAYEEQKLHIPMLEAGRRSSK